MTDPLTAPRSDEKPTSFGSVQTGGADTRCRPPGRVIPHDPSTDQRKDPLAQDHHHCRSTQSNAVASQPCRTLRLPRHSTRDDLPLAESTRRSARDPRRPTRPVSDRRHRGVAPTATRPRLVIPPCRSRVGSTLSADPAMTYPVRLTQNTCRSFASAMPSTIHYQGLVNAHREPAELLDR